MRSKKILNTKSWVVGGLLGFAMLLAGCGSSNSNNNSTVVQGSLKFVPDSAATIVVGSMYEVTLDLVGSSGVVGQEVTFTMTDPSVADVIRPVSKKCYLSSGSISSSECSVQLGALVAGRTTTLTASSPGYETQTLNIVTVASGQVNFGNLAVLNGNTDGSQYVTTSPVNLTYAADGTQLAVSAKILGSSGITGSTTIIFTPQQGAASPASCSVTTSTPMCNTVITGLPALGGSTTPIVVSAQSTQGGGKTYTPITVNAIASSSPAPSSNGKIMFETQSGQQNGSLPNGLKGPLFMWADSNGKTDTVTVNLTLTNQDGSPWTPSSPISLYYYLDGNNTTPTPVGQTIAGNQYVPSCTLSFGAAGAPFSGCGWGIMATGDSGTVVITPTYTSSSGYTYTAEKITVTAVPNDTFSRTATFKNNSSRSAWLGIANGTANAYASPTIMATQNTSASNTACGKTVNNTVGCPTGSSCMQGGANPSGSGYQCFWDIGTVTGTGASTFAITNGNPLTHKISAYSYAPGLNLALNGSKQVVSYVTGAPLQYSPNAIWSGGYIARTGCDPTTGICVAGSCNGSTANPMTCPPGVGFTNMLTKSEVTYQKWDDTKKMMDAYDVSIIAGANLTSAFGPKQSTIGNLQTGVVNSAYYCGTPGASTGQRLGVLSSSYDNFDGSQGLAQLPKNSWSMGATTASFPPGVSVTNNTIAKSYFELVANGSGGSCNVDGSCSTVGEVCGYTMSSINAGTYARSCGVGQGWITPNQLAQLNPNTLSSTFFPSNPSSYWTNSGSLSVLNYQACSGGTGSANNPVSPPINACGGVIWGLVSGSGQQSTLPINDGGTLVNGSLYTTGLNLINASSSVQTASSNWLNYVLPTIQWLKAACPTCYTFPYDDPSSTFSCAINPAKQTQDFIEYEVNFGDLPM